jgi:exo-1,4-beta-D-glucosaminidase
MTVEIENPASALAFAVNPKIIGSDSKDLVLPVFWDDNYFALLPGEKRQLNVEFSERDLNNEKPVFAIDGWNVKKAEVGIK